MRSGGAEANLDSFDSALSDDGRYVAFDSFATNLVSGDHNGKNDVFVHDCQTGSTTRVSVASDGTEANAHCDDPSISGSGRYVAFHSSADTLVAGDTNSQTDVFVHDRDTGQTIRVSLANDGSQAWRDSFSASISADGRYVAFYSDAPELTPGDTGLDGDVFVRDLQAGTTERVSVASDGAEGNGDSSTPSISADGRYVAFASYATNLVADDTNGLLDVFVHDRETGTTTRVSVASDGAQADGVSYAPAISGNGRCVTFHSDATNLVAGDTNAYRDVFVHDTEAGSTIRASVATDGTQANGTACKPAIGGEGRYVVFESWATTLVADDTNGQRDVFMHDCLTGVTWRVSVAPDGSEGDGYSSLAAIAPQLPAVMSFCSEASNLVAADTNGEFDIFVHIDHPLAACWPR